MLFVIVFGVVMWLYLFCVCYGGGVTLLLLCVVCQRFLCHNVVVMCCL